MRILTRIDPAGPVTLLVSGGVDAPCIADFDRTISAARRLGKDIMVDLSEVTVIDRFGLQYLFDLTNTGVVFVGCLPHVRRWLSEA
ncbi:MAG TPA: hypothetical protein VLV86_19900 [Vicinamibacterales bacterium]|nr:hypothetical protein [Vicinamibacterales bacterium]